MSDRLLSLLVLTSSSLSCVSQPLVHSLRLLYPGHHPPCGRNRRALNPLRTRRMRSIAPWRYTNPLTGYDYSETSAAIFQDESVDMDTEPSYSCDAQLDDEVIGKALSSPLFIQEREEPANLRQTYHSHEESLLPAQSFFHAHKFGETRFRTKKQICLKNGNQVATWKTSESGFSLKDKKQILAEVRSEIQKHELQAESDKRSIQELTGIIDSQRMEIDHTITVCEQSRRDQLLFQEELSEQNRDLRETRF